MSTPFDYVLVGGGLQSALLALAVRAHQRSARIALIERSRQFGGNHTWCFHAADVTHGARSWIEPLITTRWSSYRVLFRGLERRIEREYAAISSQQLHRVLLESLIDGSQALLGREALDIGEHEVRLTDGTRVEGRVVIDARGPAKATNGRSPSTQGYQKFIGLELECVTPHGIDTPILMDATVDQTDGFRFVYTLPFTRTRVLVEDTFFSIDPTLDRDACRESVLDYARRAELDVDRVVREEEGVLPMPWRDRFEAPRRGPLRAGYRGGFFHPATGYSLPVAARLAEHVASRPPEALFDDHLVTFARKHRRQARFCQRLNAMLFQWFPPEQRWHVFQRFYGLPTETIERFYALQLRPLDQGRLVLGRPPRGMSVRYRITQGART